MRLLVVLFCVFVAQATHALTITGIAVNVADGDTITILDGAKQQQKIRINGIDAPEKGQPFGNRSRENLTRMVHKKEVTADCNKIDRYGRHICVVQVQPADCPTCGKTVDVGHAQILAGLAWWYRQYAKDQTPDHRGRYESAEKEAQARKLGLWRDKSPTPPWEWRKTPKEARVTE